MPDADIHKLIMDKLDELDSLRLPYAMYLVVGPDVWQHLATDAYFKGPSPITMTGRAFKHYKGMDIIVVPTLGYCEVASGRVCDAEDVMRLRSNAGLHAT